MGDETQAEWSRLGTVVTCGTTIAASVRGNLDARIQSRIVDGSLSNQSQRNNACPDIELIEARLAQLERFQKAGKNKPQVTPVPELAKEVELEGLDVPEFGMVAYPEDAVHAQS